MIGLRPPLNCFGFVAVTVKRGACYSWRSSPLQLQRINESASHAQSCTRPAPIRWGRAGTLLFCGLAAHATVHAETSKDIMPASLARDVSTSGKPNAGAAPPSIVITAFNGDKIANDIDGGVAPARSVGPVDGTITPRRWTDHVASDRYASFGSRVGRIKWETVGLFAFYTGINAPKFARPTKSFHFKQEGWFGDSTESLGVDKLAHAYDTYLISEFLHARLHDKTGGGAGDAVTAALVASGVMIYSELFDGIELSSGFSLEDVAMNTSGAIFSVIRNTVPGVKEKLDFRLLMIPNSSLYTRTGRNHWAQQRYLLALKLAGFKRFEKSPLRFVEFHTGYNVSNFTYKAIARGETPKRHLFFGIGLNLRELFFKNSRSPVGRAAGTALNYLQVPYTAVHHDY